MEKSADLRQAGAGLVLVGRGTPPMTHDFRRESGFRGAIYVDPDGVAYRTADLLRAPTTRFLRWRVLSAYWRARRDGFRQTKSRSDPHQLGGTLVLSPGDRVVYAWRNTSAEDDAPLDDVLVVLRERRAYDQETRV